MANKNMKEWHAAQIANKVKKPFPILTFPCVGPLGFSVRDLVSDSEKQATGMAWIAAHTDAAAAVSFMDLSVEAECFGANVRFTDREVPTVVGRLVNDEAEAEALAVPAVGSGRTGVYLDTIRKATARITDRPVFAGMIGPFSLAARLFEVSEILMDCYDDPDMVHIVTEKATQFLVEYAKAYKAAGADGLMIAEPVAGLLSPAMEAEFSSPYVRKIVDAVQDDSFLVCYHNCGNNTALMTESILRTGALAFHFGNSADFDAILEKMPADVLVMGNIDPAAAFCLGTPENMVRVTEELLARASSRPNFVISSGCDIPPATPWANVEAFFDTVKKFYSAR